MLKGCPVKLSRFAFAPLSNLTSLKRLSFDKAPVSFLKYFSNIRADLKRSPLFVKKISDQSKGSLDAILVVSLKPSAAYSNSFLGTAPARLKATICGRWLIRDTLLSCPAGLITSTLVPSAFQKFITLLRARLLVFLVLVTI